MVLPNAGRVRDLVFLNLFFESVECRVECRYGASRFLRDLNF